MVKSFVMQEAIKLIKTEGKDALMDEINIITMVTHSLIKIDMMLNKPLKSEEYYAKIALGHKDLMSILEALKRFYFIFGTTNYDSSFGTEAKRELVKNSIEILEPFILDLKENYNYQDFQKNNDKKKTADYNTPTNQKL